jgi:hypothetical protein
MPHPGPVVTETRADYHLRMGSASVATFRLIERSGPGQRAVLRREDGSGEHLLVIAGYRGSALPDAIAHPRVTSLGGSRWSLDGDDRAIQFDARTVDEIEVRPALYSELHRRFAPGAGDRLAVRILLALLRLPGGAGLLRRWHARKGA